MILLYGCTLLHNWKLPCKKISNLSGLERSNFPLRQTPFVRSVSRITSFEVLSYVVSLIQHHQAAASFSLLETGAAPPAAAIGHQGQSRRWF